MSAEKRSLLETLKAELSFLEEGGYRRLSWRPKFIFEDSPVCLHYGDPSRSRSCSECPLIALVPAEKRDTNTPCRHIPLNEHGETVASLYHWATQEEIEAAVAIWLKKMIALAELKAKQAREMTGNPTTVESEGAKHRQMAA